MSSVKCPQCGLVLWATAQSCKRCGAPMPTAYNQPPSQTYYQPGPPPNYQTGSYQPQTPEQPPQANYQAQTSYTPADSTNSYQNNYSQTQNNQSEYGQYGYNQHSYNQQSYSQPNYNQPNYNQNYNQTHYSQQSYGYGHGSQYGQAQAPNWGYQQPFAKAALPKKTGLAMTSMILGIVGLLSCGLFGIGAILGGIFGIIGLNNAKKNSQEYGGEGMAIAGIALNALGLLIAIFAIPTFVTNFNAGFRAANRAASERSAIASVRTLHSAEVTYQSTAGQGQFGTLQQLAQQNLIDRQLGSGTKNGYRFTISLQQSSCGIYGTPLSTSSGLKSFYVSCGDGIIRGANKNGSPASDSDPVLTSDDLSPGAPRRRDRDYDDDFDDR